MVDEQYITKDVKVEYDAKTDKRKEKTKLKELKGIMDRWSEVNDGPDN